MEKSVKIYLVEDEAIAALFMRNQLKKNGIEVQKTFSSGEAVIAGAHEEKPDLLLMDINLSGVIDGIEAYKIIKAENSIPVIFITGYSNVEVRDRALELHPEAIFIKPVNIIELVEAVEKALTISKP